MDACNGGSGISNGCDWAYISWPVDMPHISEWHINCKETLSAVLAARHWGHLWANSKVRFFTDNITTRANLNKGTSGNKFIMPYLRELFWHSAIHNFEISAKYVPGIDNDLPDAISRLHLDGQLMRLGSLLGIPWHMSSLWATHCLPLHMSPNALRSLFPQILKYRHLSDSWIERWQSFVPRPSQLPPKLHIDRIGSLTCRSV